ncbi:AMP-binding protein [Salicibibacter cibi]|uniref:AMP-binding protein n=1 Tax=Salicibibacter cibi TaxID=2743001 RepID=A0A7T6ZBK5_9BACI|nr:AMP-binding protein [Salicibibacter cibi]QQK80484.1 AMP-binding protein [Salicibibacter cibi]
MTSFLKKSWPQGVPETLSYRLGEKALHEYLIQNAIDHPNKTAYNFYGNEISWEQLVAQTRRLAHFLQNKGITKGDKVALYMQNCPQYLLSHYAIQMLGGTVVPLNPMYKASELEYFINEAEIMAVIAGDELYDHIVAIKDKTHSLQFVMTTHYADFLSENVTLPLPEDLQGEKKATDDAYDVIDIVTATAPLEETASIDVWNDVGLMVFTSGTTGRPKAAMLTFGNALFKTAATAHGYQHQQEDRTLAAAPLCHIAGMVMGVNLPVYCANSCILLTRFEPLTAIQAIERYRVNKLYTVATMNAAILNEASADHDLSCLETNFATSFGMAVDEPLAEAWGKLTDGCLLFEASYGLSETHTCDTMMPMDKIKYGTCGIPTYQTDIRIVDPESGEDLPAGRQGEIAVKNPGVFKGYLNRPEATAATLRDGWVFTGDIGTLDDDGYLTFNGRVKEMIKASGYSVFPEDVEALMSDHEAIAQVAAIGVPDSKRGESVKAFVVLKQEYGETITADDIIAWSKEHMAAYKYPRDVVFVDQLPATSSGKVLRRLLKE